MTDRPPRVLFFGSHRAGSETRILMRALIVQRVALLPRGAVVIHGGAPVADLMAAHAAGDIGIHVAEVAALWSRGHRGAGVQRNQVMVDVLEPDRAEGFLACAYPLMTPGTRDTYERLCYRGIPVRLAWPDGRSRELPPVAAHDRVEPGQMGLIP
jgi:hypothetical protein